MDEGSLMLRTKSVPLLILFLICQLDSGPRSQSLALSNDTLPLPQDEASALSTVMYNMVLRPAPYISTSYCDPARDLTSSLIQCKSIEHTWHITKITMSHVHLTGIIHPDVAKLTYLETLDLSGNELHGSIPSNLGDCSFLTELDLSSNQLTGSIPPSLGNMQNLSTLRLSENLLSGMIPSSLGNLSSLQELGLWKNKLSGEIPHELGNLNQLRRLRLGENELNGTLPPELGKLNTLRYIWLSSNNLTGKLPDDYKKLVNLKEFDVGGNYLEGPIPEYFAELKSLTKLVLIGNNFEGELPSAIFNMQKLSTLLVSDLNSTGFKFPPSVNLPNIFILVLRNCNIIGEIPPYIGNWSTLRYIDLSFNNLIGRIPDSFRDLNLNELFLTGNMLNGMIPDWINETVINLGDLSLNNFIFNGPRKVHFWDLPYNNSENVKDPETVINVEPENRPSVYHFMDEHCGKKSKYHSLFINCGGEITTIGRNRYDSDNIAASVYASPSKNWAYSCSGSFLYATTNSSDFIKNISCGVSVPQAPLYENARLCPQSLTYYGFCLKEGEYNVTLHFAEVIYTKDEDYSSSEKRVFDIFIQGQLVIRDFNLKAVAGGPNKIRKESFTAHVDKNHLLEIRLFWAGKGSIYNFHGPLISAIAVTPNFKVGGLSTIEIIGIAAAAVLAVSSSFAFMWWMGWVGDRVLLVTIVTLQGNPYSLKQLKDATGNFSSKNEIGRGRFGKVYKATLPDQNTVAVKKLSLESKVDRIGTEMFASKGKQLKQLKHENLVELLDVCSMKDLGLMIYEYMEIGSIKQALFDDSISKVKLDWETRFNICLGIARGLKYLHEDTNGKIVHRDVKLSNVLLDGNLNAKVSDFGLAMLFEEEDPSKFIDEIGVNMAPEYATRKDITDKIDVYSYGIVVLEIVSGKSNSKCENNDYLLNEACVLHSNKRSVELVDKSLSDDFDRCQAVKILDLAMKCVNLAPTLRPTMAEVVNELEQIAGVPQHDLDLAPTLKPTRAEVVNELEQIVRPTVAEVVNEHKQDCWSSLLGCV